MTIEEDKSLAGQDKSSLIDSNALDVSIDAEANVADSDPTTADAEPKLLNGIDNIPTNKNGKSNIFRRADTQ